MQQEIIRKTKSVCPGCLRTIEAIILEQNGKVYLDKNCPVHGNFSLLLSNHPDYYRGLSNFYFPLMDKTLPQRDYILHLSNKCELNCTICLAQANQRPGKDYPLHSLQEFLKRKKGYKIDLMGAEPTQRDDLPQIIRSIKRSGNIAALHTNGIKIADYDYLKKLKRSGLDEVHLQFDGFSDDVYQKIRGRKLLAIKLKTLANLEQLNLATDLVATIVRQLNENEMIKILDFAVKHHFVKEVFFLGCRFLGQAKKLPITNCLMPDELIDILEQQTRHKISRENVFAFQKLYFGLLSALSIRKCFYIQHFMLVRKGQGYLPINKLFNLKKVQPILDRFQKLKSAKRKFASAYLLLSLTGRLFRSKGLFLWKDFFCLALPLIQGFNLARLGRRSILLGFISACDSYSFDSQIAANCGKGAISSELGIQESGALDNILRDNLKTGKPDADSSSGQ